MNIHYWVGPQGFEYLTTAQYRQRTGERKPTSKGTKPPRSRAGQTYPGGRELRRALAELSRRQSAHQATVGGIKRGKSINPEAYQKPGSMKTRAR